MLTRMRGRAIAPPSQRGRSLAVVIPIVQSCGGYLTKGRSFRLQRDRERKLVGVSFARGLVVCRGLVRVVEQVMVQEGDDHWFHGAIFEEAHTAFASVIIARLGIHVQAEIGIVTATDNRVEVISRMGLVHGVS
jgi:hypothetical protein